MSARDNFYNKLNISISGLIGAGKSTLTTSLAKQMGIPAYYEPIAENEYLEDFYGDMSRFAFPLQIYLLNLRFKQQQNITWKQNGGISDRTIYEDSIFCKVLYDSGHMTEREYRLYTEMFDTLSNFIVHPDVIIHLDVSPEESLRRIKSRGREMESNITVEYLELLHKSYDEWMDNISKTIPIIRLNWSEFKDPELVEEKIRTCLESMRNISHINFD